MYTVYRHSCLSCLTGSAVLSVERTERQNSAYRWTCSHYPALLASPTQRYTQTNTGNYTFRSNRDLVKLRARVLIIEECPVSVRPRRGQVAWAWVTPEVQTSDPAHN